MLDDTIRERATQAAARAWKKADVPLDSFHPAVRGGFRRVVDAVADVLADSPVRRRRPEPEPLRDAIAQAIRDSAPGGGVTYVTAADAVLDILARRGVDLTEWQPIEPEQIRLGMRVRRRLDRDGIEALRTLVVTQGDASLGWVGSREGGGIALDAPGCTWHVDAATVPVADVLADSSAVAHPAAAPIVLPTVDEMATAIEDSDAAEPSPGDRLDPYQRNARAVLDLIASRVPVWQPVEPGTVIKAGTRYRIEYGDGRASEHVASFDRKVDDSGPLLIDPRTVPAEDPRVAVVAQALSDALDDTCDWTPEARDILARLDAEVAK